MLHRSTSLRLSKFEVASLQTWLRPKTRWRCICRGHSIASLTWVLRWLGHQASEDLHVFSVGHSVPTERNEKVANLHVLCGAHRPYSGTMNFHTCQGSSPFGQCVLFEQCLTIQGKKADFSGFPRLSWICRDFRSAGGHLAQKIHAERSKSTCRVTAAMGFHAERSSNVCACPAPHLYMVNLKDIDNIEPQKIVSSLPWSQCDHPVFTSSRITSTSCRKLVEEVHSVLGNIQIDHLLPLVLLVAFSNA